MVGRNFQFAAEHTDLRLDAPSRAQLDLLDAAATLDYIRASQPDIVLHCAGIVGGIQANIAAPYEFAFGNLQLGMNVLRAAFEAGVARLLNLGSSCMYPRNAPNPLREEAILSGELEPTNEAYALAKITIARLCSYLGAEHHMQYKTVIPCNLYGRFDDFDAATAHLVPAAIRKVHDAVANGNDSVEIWGDGTVRREFMYAGDLADFLCFAIHNFDRLDEYTNVGLGLDYSVNDYYQAVAEVVGFTGRFTHDLTKPAGMQQKLVDSSKQIALGWQPQTTLLEGIRKTYDYFCSVLGDDRLTSR